MSDINLMDKEVELSEKTEKTLPLPQIPDDEDDILYRMGFREWSPEWLQRFNSMKWFIVILSICSLAQGFVVAGLSAVSIESIEKEFGLSSKMAGIILGGQHASQVLIVTYVSFFGERGHKPKWIGIGSVITGAGAITFAVPKLIAGPYTPGSQYTDDDNNLCPSNHTWTGAEGWGGKKQDWDCEDEVSGNTMFNLILLFVGQFIMGAGGTPVYTLGPAYLDENVAPAMSPIYLGIWMTCTMMGPALGFALGGVFLNMYTDVDLPNNLDIDSSDTRWVGAWWFGFVIMSLIFIVNGFIILLYPKQMKQGSEERKHEIKLGHLPGYDRKVQYTVRGYLTECLKLASNKVLMLMILGATIQSLYGAGVFGFAIKVLTLKYGVSATKASVVIGVALVFTMLGGIMGGACVMRKIKVQMAGKRGAQICVVISLLTVASSFIWAIPGCNNTNLAGILEPYDNSTLSSSLLSTCNTKCMCVESTYLPVCGSDSITYHSPCYAGCTTTVEGTDGVVYTNCSCIPQNIKTRTTPTIPLSNIISLASGSANKSKPTTITKGNRAVEITQQIYGGYARSDKCDRGCKNFYYFVLLCLFVWVVGGLAAIPYKIVILRCVADNKRSFALGAQKLLMKVFQLPGPLLVGSIVDTDCISWAYDRCGRKKNCLDYDINMMSNKLVIFGLLSAAAGCISFAIGSWLYPNTPKVEGGTDSNSNHQQELDVLT